MVEEQSKTYVQVFSNLVAKLELSLDDEVNNFEPETRDIVNEYIRISKDLIKILDTIRVDPLLLDFVATMIILILNGPITLQGFLLDLHQFPIKGTDLIQ